MNSGSLKSLRLFWTCLAKNQRYQGLIDMEDVSTFNRRSENEGLHFMTTALPMIGKALDEFHATTVWNPPEHFECDGEGIPLFLGRPIRLALKGDSLAVDLVRQMTYLFYKLEVDYDKATVDRFLDQFINTDRGLDCAYDPRDNFVVKDHVAHMRRLIMRVLCNADPYDIRPCHGSGATACRTVNGDKWHLLRYYPKLDVVYPYADYFFYSMSHLIDEMEKLEDSAESVPRARVVLVPKDSRGPRIISCEPAELMYIQQGLMRLLYRTIENHPITRGQINFTDQRVNRDLARLGSLDGSWATLDLSEASDRLSLRLVRDLFPANWFECLEACRSEETELPDGVVVKLSKFAPMGSACCFPVEALVFWASAVATQRRFGNKNPVYVYGDDIIIKPELVQEVIKDLESVGLVINTKKSFAVGPFRESCGGDYHYGNDVTPVRVRKPFGTSNTCIATGADLCNLLVAKFGYEDSKPLIDIIEKEVGYVYPRSELCLPSTILYKACASNDVFFARRWNKSLQRFEHRVLQMTTEALALRQPTWSELLRKELSVEHRSSTADSTTMDKTKVSMLPGVYAEPHSATAKWDWVWLG